MDKIFSIFFSMFLHLFSFETPIINVFLNMLKKQYKDISNYYISNNNENK
jgi:hypothetical protein